MRRELLNALLIALGILAAAFGFKDILLSSNFIDGGVTGVSMLLTKITPLAVRRFQFEHHDRDDHREHAVAERFEPSFGHRPTL